MCAGFTGRHITFSHVTHTHSLSLSLIHRYSVSIFLTHFSLSHKLISFSLSPCRQTISSSLSNSFSRIGTQTLYVDLFSLSLSLSQEHAFCPSIMLLHIDKLSLSLSQLHKLSHSFFLKSTLPLSFTQSYPNAHKLKTGSDGHHDCAKGFSHLILRTDKGKNEVKQTEDRAHEKT